MAATCLHDPPENLHVRRLAVSRNSASDDHHLPLETIISMEYSDPDGEKPRVLEE
ncbi:hypothetical protein HPP92_001983 [Vanilla planifolia]|uniref:Uncharacterized protein n=1 Tax=Vanilla planifolia TaxID=51239 RepID=A0A835VG36_VANPL|nr:hypothetical protein HPP92_002233 [Vanilla planifolia]KAG0501911.1 hypothetical protein HPP92_001983 [Vanilla planifolia]